MDIVQQRLINEHLSQNPLSSPEAAIGWFGAVQSQDYLGAKWGLAQRTNGFTSSQIDELFNAGKILRTHILRPTWHFVLPEDIVWLQQLTGPRVKALNRYMHKQLELDETYLQRTNDIIATGLRGNNFLTRAGISQLLEKSGVKAKGVRLAYIVMWAELDALICSGPLKGKQHTYRLVTEVAPKTKKLDRESALTELAARYFTSHGPATAKDFAWWSGLTVADANLGAKLAKLSSENIGGKTYWFEKKSKSNTDPNLHLLPNYDEYVISYQDYSPVLVEVKKLHKPFGNALLPHLIVRNGQIVGLWRRRISNKLATVEAEILVKLTSTEQAMLQAEAQKFGKFLNLPVKLVT